MVGQFLTAAQVRALARGADDATDRWLDLSSAPMSEAYNRRPFELNHRLHEHPMFKLDRLLELCHRLPAGEVHLRVGQVPVDTDFDTSLSRYRQGLTLEDAIAHFEERRAYIAVYNPERDPTYRPIIEGLLGEIAREVEPLDPGINWYSTYLFISAQGSVTPYHMDREMNFLLQIRGRKTVKLWNPNDPDIMSAPEKDRLMGQRDDPRPPYRAELDHRAEVFELVPGRGVHHPFIAPHLVTTGPALSITLAITFRTRGSDDATDAHTFNYRMRRLGLQPTEVGRHRLLDLAKARLIRHVRRAVHGGRDAVATLRATAAR